MPKALRTYLGLGFVGLSFWLSHSAHGALLTFKKPASEKLHETLPSPQALEFLALGYPEVVADYYWLKTLDHFGRTEMHKHLYPDLYPLCERVLSLDPYFAGAYYFASATLTLNGMDVARANKLVEPGLVYRPDVWRIPFMLGFNSYHFLGDVKKAVRYFEMTLPIDGRPDYVPALLAGLTNAAGEPEVGVDLLSAIIHETQNEELRARYEERRKLLLIEVHAKQIRHAVKRYRQEGGTNPVSLQALLLGGYLETLPTQPFGGEYFLDEKGELQTDKSISRLEVPKTQNHQNKPKP